MDSNTDDRDPEMPPDVPPDELQEALQWLAELAGQPSAGPQMNEPAAESPFHGLVDDGAGDLPDWLREAPKEPADPRLTDDGEFESRLDWLAKMAERESIEELPTLEWRNLSGTTAPPAEGDGGLLTDDTLPPTFPAELLPIEATPSEPLAAEAELHLPAAPPDQPADEPPAADDTADDRVPEAIILEAAAGELTAPDDDELAAPLPDEALPAIDPVAPITPEALIDSLPPDVELPPIDDLDAAMAWIEELAASQDAPIEDVPSVADRALASKLMMEAGLSPDGLDLRPGNELALGDLSLLEGNTPINAFVAAEDFADTIVLVETMAAEQGRTLAAPPELPDAAAPPVEASFDEAMAFLDELAIDNEPLGALTQPLEPIVEEAAVANEPVADEAVLAGGAIVEAWLVETETETEAEWLVGAEPVEAEMAAEVEPALVAEAEIATEESDEALSPADAPWLVAAAETVDEWVEPQADPVAPGDEMAQTEAITPAAVAANGNVAATLEDTLRALDALALPAGQSLAEYDVSLRQRGAQPVRRDLPAAVEWLELALGISVPRTPPAPMPAPPLSDDELINQMPEDPDAVLAWLELMAEEDTIDSSPRLSPAAEALPDAGSAPATIATVAATEQAGGAIEPLGDELSEADLANMPEDPDAVMAWLEGLAGGGKPAAVATALAAPLPEAPAAPESSVVAEQPAPVKSSRSRRRRGRKAQTAATMAAVETALDPLVAEGADKATPQATDDLSVPNEANEMAAPDAPSFEVVDVAPVTEGEESESVVAPVEVALSGPLPDIAEEPTAEPAEPLPLPASPRRRGRKPKAATTAEVEPAEVVSAAAEEVVDAVEAAAEPLPLPASPRRRGRKPTSAATAEVEPAEVVSAVAEEAVDAGEATAEPVAEVTDAPPATPPETEEAPPPPAKPASWVDLLKPLK